MKPGDGLVFEGDGTRTQVRPVRSSSPFEKFRGIGNGRAGSGGKAVVRAIRECAAVDEEQCVCAYEAPKRYRTSTDTKSPSAIPPGL